MRLIELLMFVFTLSFIVYGLSNINNRFEMQQKEFVSSYINTPLKKIVKDTNKLKEQKNTFIQFSSCVISCMDDKPTTAQNAEKCTNTCLEINSGDLSQSVNPYFLSKYLYAKRLKIAQDYKINDSIQFNLIKNIYARLIKTQRI